MPALLGAVVLLLLLWAASGFAKADPKLAARALRLLGGAGALLFAAFLLFRGQIVVALPLGALGLGLLGWKGPWSAALGNWMPGQAKASQVRSAFLEMELDPKTGVMRGRILAGRYEGAPLEALDVPTLVGFLGDVDDDSRRLLMAYLDRRQPAWRENAQDDTAAGQGSGGSSGGKMTEEEAYQVLGLQPGASADEIARAHRSLMKKLHPDQGGSTYLAARVNQAKDVLSRRHR
jgi:hypothetical protein